MPQICFRPETDEMLKMPAAPLAHPRNYSLGHGHQAKHVRLKLGAKSLLPHALFENAEVPEPGVVDEHVDAPKAFDGCLQVRLYLLLGVSRASNATGRRSSGGAQRLRGGLRLATCCYDLITSGKSRLLLFLV